MAPILVLKVYVYSLKFSKHRKNVGAKLLTEADLWIAHFLCLLWKYVKPFCINGRLQTSPIRISLYTHAVFFNTFLKNSLTFAV